MELSLQEYGNVLAALRKTSGQGAHERRQHSRLKVQANVAVAALQNGRIVRVYTALTRDISIAGIGLMQGRAVEGRGRLVVRLPSAQAGHPEIPMVCETAGCRPIAEGIFEVGAQFVQLADAALLREWRGFEAGELARIRHAILK